MKPETQEKMLRAIDRLYSRVGRVMGLDGYEAVMQYLLSSIEHPGMGQEVARRMLADGGLPEEPYKGKKLHKAYSAIETREKVRARLAELPEPQPATVEWFITATKNLPLQLREGLLPLAKKLPHRAGKSARLTPQGADAVCEQLKQLIANGIGTKEAQRQIAARMGLSLRTIQRIYSQRRDIQS